YFYVLRPILAMNWIERGWGVVPTDFNILVDKLAIEPPVAKEIAHLLAAKRAGVELDRGPRIETLSRFIAAELDRWEKNDVIHQQHTINSGKLDELFRATLAKAWRARLRKGYDGNGQAMFPHPPGSETGKPCRRAFLQLPLVRRYGRLLLPISG
ncbi:MAG: nucleotidyltransferase domain-containing protein, partial [Syntrophales bacterium]|nr:nucleotidyltransferase domain-containing protein [Syntrophales bacterium]